MMTESGSRRLAWICLIESFLLSITQTFIALGLGQEQFIFNNSAWLYGIFSVICMCYFASICVAKIKIRIAEAFAILFILFSLLNMYLTASMHNGFSQVGFDTLLEFGVKALPAMLLACAASRKKILPIIIKYVDYIVVIGTICIAKTIGNSLLFGVSRAYLFGTYGVDYQEISYFASYFCSLALYMVFSGKSWLERGFRTTRTSQIIRIICIIILSFSSLYSGGRGGFVVIVTMLFFWLLIYSINKKQVGRFVGGIAIVAMLVAIANIFSKHNSIFSTNVARVFEFIGNGGINWHGTSGREDIYQRAFALIREKPFLGYGFTGGSYNGVISTHNFFFEILVDGGIVYLCFWLFILVRFGTKLKSLIKGNDQYLFLLIAFLTDFVGLMFSFIYWRCSAMWFAIFYVLNVSPENSEALNEKQ